MAVFFSCPHMAEGTRELSEVSFIRVLIPFVKAEPNHHPKAPTSNTITLEVRISMYEFGDRAQIFSP